MSLEFQTTVTFTGFDVVMPVQALVLSLMTAVP